MDLGKGNLHPHTHTKTSLSRRNKGLELECRQLRISGDVASTSEGSRGGLWCPQLPQTFPDHKNRPVLVPPEPQAIMWRKWRGPMPGTSQFLVQCERDTAHVGVVVRLGTVEHVFQGPGWG